MRLFRHCVQLVLGVALAVGGLAVTAPAAQAEPVPAGQELYVDEIGSFQNPNNNTVIGFYVTPADTGGDYAPDGTVLALDTYSCGNHLGSATKVVSAENGRGAVVNFSEAAIKKVGQSIQYTLTITQAGYDPYQRSGSYSGYTVKRPSCDQINNPTPAPNTSKMCRVTKWSAKVSGRNGKSALVGGLAKVSATKSPNCKVTYKWTLNGVKAGNGRSLFLKRSMMGKNLAMKIVVKKSGLKRATKTLRYGLVRQR